MTESKPTPAGSAASPVRLGDLLTGAGLLRPDDLRQAMLIAKSQNLPVGRVLIMSGYIVEPHLQAAVHAQSMLKDGLLDFETALGALRAISRERITFEDALSRLGWKQQNHQTTNKLGELLVEAAIVDQAQLAQALQQGQTSGLPLGRVLVVNGMLTEQLLASVLNAQILIRDKRITREQAITGLKDARERQVPIEQTLSPNDGQSNPGGESVRLGELLVMAKLLDEEKLMQAVELGLVNEQPIGQVLVASGTVNEQCLQNALAIQNMVAQGKLRKSLAGQVLNLMINSGISLEQAVDQIQPRDQQISNNLPLYQFLQLAGIIGPKDIEEALKAGSRNAQLMGQMLLMTSALDQHLLATALKCSDLMGQGILKTEQAVIALGICWKSKISIEDAFKQLGWNQSILRSFTPSAATIFFSQNLPAPRETSSGVFNAVGSGTHSTLGSAPTQAPTPAPAPPRPQNPNATMAHLPAMSPGQALTITTKMDETNQEQEPQAPAPAKKRLSDLIPKPQ